MKLQTGRVYILSGPSEKRREKFLRDGVKKGELLPEMILRSDEIRERSYGKFFQFKAGKVKKKLYRRDEEVFEVLQAIARERLREGLTVFVDAGFVLTDKDREPYIKLAQEHGMEAEVLIFNSSYEELINEFGEDLALRLYQRFEQRSKYRYTSVLDGDISLYPANVLDFEKIDVVGDIHGVYDRFIQLAASIGYILDKEKGMVHPDGRKILFLGDTIDRGPDSLKMIKLVMKMVENGHYFIKGNHEDKNLKNLESNHPSGSYAIMKTYYEMLRDKDFDVKKFMEFIKKAPAYYLYKDLVLCHGNISCFDYRRTPNSELMYGTYKWNAKKSDSEYVDLYKRGVNKQKLVRGHVTKSYGEDIVFSLELGVNEGGKIGMLALDKFVKLGSDRKAFDSALSTISSEFVFKPDSETIDNLLNLENRELKKDFRP